MKFTETDLAGAYLIEPERTADERGFFARTFCANEFAEHGLATAWVQCSVSHNHRCGTLRGMHYQTGPHAEDKLVRCTTGAIHDVIIDLRPESATFREHFAAELTAEDCTLLYIPKGFAHGFLTLSDDAEVFYQMSGFYAPQSTCGVRWDDPAFGIAWPEPVCVISKRDQAWPDFSETRKA